MSAKMQGEVARELADLKAMGKYLKSIAAIFTAGISFLPLAAIPFDVLVPPWRATPVLAVGCPLISVAACFLAMRESDPVRLWRRAIWLWVTGAVLMGLYLGLYFATVYEGRNVRVVTGFALNAEARDRLKRGEIENDQPEAVLGTAGYRSPGSVYQYHRTASFLLVAVFVLSTTCLVTGFFLMLLRNVVRDRPQAGSRTIGEKKGAAPAPILSSSTSSTTINP